MSEQLALIKEHMKVAMKAGEKERLAAIRLILTAVKQHEVDKREDVSDEILLGILTKMAKQRRESISQYKEAGRDDLIQVEEFELGIINGYLPEQMSEDDVAKLIDEAMAGLESPTVKDMGKIMGQLKPKIQGRADMGMVSKLIKDKLG